MCVSAYALNLHYPYYPTAGRRKLALGALGPDGPIFVQDEATAEAAAASVSFDDKKSPSTPPAKGNKKNIKGILKNTGTPHSRALRTAIYPSGKAARDPRLRGVVVQGVPVKAPRGHGPPPLARSASENQDLATFSALIHHRRTVQERKWQQKLIEAQQRYDLLYNKYEGKCKEVATLTIQNKAALAAARTAQGRFGKAARNNRRQKEDVQTVVDSVGRSVAKHETFAQRELGAIREQIKHCFGLIESRLITHVTREHKAYVETFNPIRYKLIDGGAGSPPAKKGRQ